MTSLKNRTYYHLLTNGCSFVWGDELEGCEDNPPAHQEHRFSTKLRTLMSTDLKRKVTHDCIATCGGGNKKIFRDTISYLSDPSKKTPTHMVIMWSALQRNEVFEIVSSSEYHGLIQRQQNLTQYSPERITSQFPPGGLRDLLKEWYDKHYKQEVDVVQLFTYMQAIKILCRSKNITLVQGVFHTRVYSGILATLANATSEDGGDNKDYMQWVRGSVDTLDWNDKLGIPFSKNPLLIPNYKYPALMHEFVDMYNTVCCKYKMKPYGHPDERTHKEIAQTLMSAFHLLENNKRPQSSWNESANLSGISSVEGLTP